ncbi:hypothetical protein HDU83_009425 [Entophlyctis luteolus]|nr:hypothetical protein HDU83_009425 [Entophlyctis luteolus]
MNVTPVFLTQFVITYCVLAGIALIQLLVYVPFILFIEVEKRNLRPTARNILTPINSSLLLGNLALIGLFSVRAGSLSHYVGLKITWFTMLEILFIGSCETTYIFFSWSRSGKLLGTVASPKAYKFVYYAVQLSPTAFFLPLIPTAATVFSGESEMVPLLSWMSIFSQLFGGLVLAALDSLLVAAFVGNTKLTLSGNEVNKEFQIVTIHGIISCVLIYGSVVMHGVAALTQDTSARGVRLAIGESLLVIISIVQFCMKASAV